MPSGSHGGSSGSHSSGGSRSSSGGGSHSSSGSSYRSGSHRSSSWSHSSYSDDDYGSGGGWNWTPRPPKPHYTKRINVFTSGKSIAVFFITFFMIIFCLLIFGCGMAYSNKKSDVKKIETDYMYYQAMIEDAENNPQCLITGYISGLKKNNTVDKWFIEYKFKDQNNVWVEGYTYSVYDDNQIKAFEKFQEIELAVNSYPITQNTDSIPTDYKNMPLERDGEWVYERENLKGIKITMIAISIITGFLLVTCIIVLFTKKSNNGKSTSLISCSLDNQTNIDENDPKLQIYVCPYCGGESGIGNAKCPYCGATIKKRKSKQ